MTPQDRLALAASRRRYRRRRLQLLMLITLYLYSISHRYDLPVSVYSNPFRGVENLVDWRTRPALAPRDIEELTHR